MHYPGVGFGAQSALASDSTFTLKFFNGLYFLNPLMDLVHI